MNNKEEFRDIKGYKGLYQVSNMGRVKSLERMVKHYRGGHSTIKEKILKANKDNKGYRMVNLFEDGKKTSKRIYQLVAIEFHGHIPNGHIGIVDHINGIKIDDRATNLRIVTHRENISTCFRGNDGTFTSEYIGVYWHILTQKWIAQIVIKGKNKYLGSFINEIDAHKAYQKALLNEYNPEYFKSIKPTFTSKYIGVSWHKANNKWVAHIRINNKQKYLGSFIEEIDAHKAYQEALKKINK